MYLRKTALAYACVGQTLPNSWWVHLKESVWSKVARAVAFIHLLGASEGSQLQPCAAQEAGGGWQRGRVTYFGAPEKIAAAYDPSRGKGSFGILAFGSCGYTNADGSLPFPDDQPAASADGSSDYPGSCGRCYEIVCDDSTEVLNNQGSPISIVNGFYEGDKWRPYLPAINRNVTDTQGRPFPGNPGEAQGIQRTTCLNPAKTLKIRITDSCPCTQVLQEGAPGVAAGGEVRPQNWCCKASGLTHLDISYWAFEQLFHPLFGVGMVQIRPVDCDSNAPVPASPGYINRDVIYSGGTKAGWSWQSYKASGQQWVVPGATSPAGSPSTCLTLSPGGGLQFRCRSCSAPGYQPFSGATGISFWIRSDAKSADIYESSTPQGQIPNLKLILQKQETKSYCPNQPTTGSLTPAAGGSGGNSTAAGGWVQFLVPLSAFGCDGGLVNELTQLEFQNPNERNAIICVAEIRIQR